MYIYIFIHIYIHMYIHIFMHTYIHAFIGYVQIGIHVVDPVLVLVRRRTRCRTRVAHDSEREWYRPDVIEDVL